jgi:glycosyltransferase involved in cell wall biosynthesis
MGIRCKGLLGSATLDLEGRDRILPRACRLQGDLVSQAMDGDTVLDCVVTPADAVMTFRRRLGLPAGEQARIAYIPGPGDVVGTFGHWLEGRHDPRVPVVAYSTMFYTLVEKLDATALVVTQIDNAPEIAHPRCRFVHVRPESRTGRINYALGRILDAIRLARTIADYRPHAVVVSTDAPTLLFHMLPRGARIVLSAHIAFWPRNRRRRDPLARLKNAGLALGFRRLSSAVCTSQECRDQIAALRGGAEALYVEIPQFPALITPQPRPATSARRLLFLGRVEREKGVFDLLSAFERLSTRFPDASLDVAGVGTAMDNLAAQVAGSPCRERIRLLGWLQGADVHAALDNADLLVCPTRSSEGLALVVVEAAAHGVPSVVSSVVPAQDLFPGGCSVFPADDVAALSRRLEDIMADDAAYAALRQAATADAGRFTDRSLSWGSALCRALLD